MTHTFAICAYKESEYLEDCIKSIMRQSVKTKVIMTTSTPCAYISDLAEKYDIPLYVRDGASDIKDDWNFAYDMAETEWVTVAHQDDLYSKYYAEVMLRKISETPDAIMFLSDYMPIKNGKIGKRGINSTLRRILRMPLKVRSLASARPVKKAVLSLGNSICCPTVAYNKTKLGPSVFTSEMKFNIDWDTFLKLAGERGSFAYADIPLTFYRIHDGATSKDFIVNHLRESEDTAMFEKFWPGVFARFIMKFYKKAYDVYG